MKTRNTSYMKIKTWMIDDISRKLEDSEVINFTINKSNVYNESNALAAVNTTSQEKVDMVSKQKQQQNRNAKD